MVAVVCVHFVLRQGLSRKSWQSWNSLCRPGWPRTHRGPPASASLVLRLKACTSTLDYDVHLNWCAEQEQEKSSSALQDLQGLRVADHSPGRSCQSPDPASASARWYPPTAGWALVFLGESSGSPAQLYLILTVRQRADYTSINTMPLPTPPWKLGRLCKPTCALNVSVSSLSRSFLFSLHSRVSLSKCRVRACGVGHGKYFYRSVISVLKLAYSITNILYHYTLL